VIKALVPALLACGLLAFPLSAGEHHFQFGSYGRVNFSTDLYGGRGSPSNVVQHGVRLEEPSYAELNFHYQLNRNDARELNVHTVFTLALFDSLFHYTGQADSALAVRNLYGYAENVLPGLLHLWVGSRMYRGDDIYLLDFWPLDNLNTLGGGAEVTLGDDWLFAAHAGFNRLDDTYYHQEVLTSAPGFGTENLLYLDRQKLITSFKAQRQFFKLGGTDLGIKFKLYGEFHALPKGGILRDDTATYQKESWPADNGWLAGAQVGLWGFGQNGFLNVWARYAAGLAAYGELAVPWDLGPDKKSTRAREILTAVMANWEGDVPGFLPVGVMAGGYLRWFRDADPNSVDLDDGWETIWVARPALFVTDHYHQIFEVSFQHKDPFGLAWSSGRHEQPQVWKAAVIPALSMGRGSFARPQFRFVLSASHLNQAARNLYPLDDPRRGRAWEYFAGVQVEWWYYSSYR
jgi:maltoporin